LNLDKRMGIYFISPDLVSSADSFTIHLWVDPCLLDPARLLLLDEVFQCEKDSPLSGDSFACSSYEKEKRK